MAAVFFPQASMGCLWSSDLRFLCISTPPWRTDPLSGCKYDPCQVLSDGFIVWGAEGCTQLAPPEACLSFDSLTLTALTQVLNSMLCLAVLQFLIDFTPHFIQAWHVLHSAPLNG